MKTILLNIDKCIGHDCKCNLKVDEGYIIYLYATRGGTPENGKFICVDCFNSLTKDNHRN